MPGSNNLVTENFLRLNFSPKSGVTPGTNDIVSMGCDQILARYSVDISGVTATGLRLPGQNQLTASYIPPPPAGYGCLYNYWVLANLAAAGWKVPEDADWHVLALCLDANAIYPTPPATSESTVAGAYLKETGTAHWSTPNTGATNSSGFAGLPEGARDYRGAFYNRGYTTTWASSTESGTDAFYYRSLGYDNTNIYRGFARKQYGFSVRLLKLDSTDPGTYTGNDGTVYSTVKIGNQVWTLINISETKDNTGALIPVINAAAAWEALTTGAMCTYVA